MQAHHRRNPIPPWQCMAQQELELNSGWLSPATPLQVGKMHGCVSLHVFHILTDMSLSPNKSLSSFFILEVDYAGPQERVLVTPRARSGFVQEQL